MGPNFCHSWEGKGIELGNPYNLWGWKVSPPFQSLDPQGWKSCRMRKQFLKGRLFHKGCKDHFSCPPAPLPATLLSPFLKVLFRHWLASLYIVWGAGSKALTAEAVLPRPEPWTPALWPAAAHNIPHKTVTPFPTLTFQDRGKHPKENTWRNGGSDS